MLQLLLTLACMFCAVFIAASLLGADTKSVWLSAAILPLPLMLCLKALYKRRKAIKRLVYGHLYYLIVCFYFMLYFGSLYSLFHDFFRTRTAKFPQIDIAAESIVWARIPCEKHVLHSVNTPFNAIMLITHFASFLSFLKALTAPRGNKNCHQPEYFDGILYQETDCEKCGPISPRMSHCSYCGTCLQRRDHHCVWLGYCVYEANLPAFNAFLACTALASLLVSILQFTFLYIVYNSDESSDAQFNIYKQENGNSTIPISLLKQLITFPVSYSIQWYIDSFPVEAISLIMHALIAVLLLPFSLFHLRNFARGLTHEELLTRAEAIRLVRGSGVYNLYVLECLNKKLGYYYYLNQYRFQKQIFPVLLLLQHGADTCQIQGMRYVRLPSARAVQLLQNYSPYRRRGTLCSVAPEE